MIFDFKKKVEKFLLDESGLAPKKGILAGGLIGFALSATAASAANDITISFKDCWGVTSDGTLTFKMHGDASAGLVSYDKFGTDVPPPSEEVIRKLYAPESGEDYTPIISTYNDGLEDIDVSDHLYHCDGWCLGQCKATDHFSTSGEIDTDFETHMHKNELRLDQSGDDPDTIVASHAHDIQDFTKEEVQWHVSDHFDGRGWTDASVGGTGGDASCGDHHSDAIKNSVTKYVCKEDDETWDT
jgi:hypothetical protein